MVIPRTRNFLTRLFSTSTSPRNALQLLKNRSLIQIKGPDVSEFLQGLITNDIQHLSYGVGSLLIMENDSTEESLDMKPSTSKVKSENTQSETEGETITEKDHIALQYFECTSCKLREKFEYFGKDPPFLSHYKLLEDAYIIEDPFLPPKSGKVIILGSHCVKCNKMICKSTGCSIYFDSMFCIPCAKQCMNNFPKAIQEKLNRIVI